MANRLKMAEHQAILGLHRLNWSYRRIAAELGVDRETVSRHVKAAEQAEAVAARGDPPGAGPPAPGSADPNAAIVIAGSGASPASPASGSAANATIVIAGSSVPPEVGSAAGISAGRRSRCERWRAVIVA